MTIAAAPVVDNNAGASNVTVSAATLNGNLTSTGSAPTTVRIYWGRSDGGTNAAAWTNSANLGIRSVGAFSTNVTGLSSNTVYYYRCWASNAAGVVWAATGMSFVTLAPTPVVNNGAGASNVTVSSATLNGTLISTGSAPTTVRIYWGPSDGGTNVGSWTNSANLGIRPVGAFSTNVTGLSPNTLYYYRSWASNAPGVVWAPATTNFRTPFLPVLVVTGSPAARGVSSPFAYGTTSVQPGTVVTNTVATPVDASNGSRWVCTGWTGIGSVPASGSTNTVVFTITNDSTLTWNWTPQYLLDTEANAGGTVAPGGAWYTAGTRVSVYATANVGYAFSRWSGDVPAGLALPANAPTNIAAADYFGSAAARVGDLDGDGIADVMIGSPYGAAGDRGRTHVLLLRNDGTVRASQEVGEPSPNNNDHFGAAIGAVGDLDGDGTPDMAVGAPNKSVGYAEAGVVYIVFLNSNGTARSTASIDKIASGLPLAQDDHFGTSVAGLGDVNGDGVEGLAVGATGDDGIAAEAGAVHVMFLGTNGIVQSPVLIGDGLGLAAGDAFGASVAALGDLDGDGVQDLAVGATGCDDGATNAGCVYAVFLNTAGTITMKSGQKISATTGGGPSLHTNDCFGSAVACIGDLDGDGVQDLAVGAPGDSDGATNAGCLYILYMQTNGTARAYQKISAGAGSGPELAAGDRFGASVASLGDVDGDGVGDLIVGATGDDDGGVDAGAAYVLFMRTNGTVKAMQKISRSNNPLRVVMDRPRAITASFSRPGNIAFAPARLDQTGLDAQNPPSQTVQVWNAASTLPMTYALSTNAAWLSVEPSGGTSRSEQNPITVHYSTAGLTNGRYEAAIVITSVDATNSPQIIPVSLTVVATPAHYVRAGNAGAQPPYLDWASAAASIQAAVDIANAGDTILVSNGVYQTGSRVVYGSMSNRVVIDKAITVESVNGPEQTFIVGRGPLGDGAIRCVYLAAGAVLKGFTLTNGYTRAAGHDFRERSGGGAWCESDTAVLSNCVLVANSADYCGGGVYLGNSIGCRFLANSADYGGGLANGSSQNSSLERNRASFQGGAIYKGSAYNSLMVSNAAVNDAGGGAYFSTLINCTVCGNSAHLGGGISESDARNSIVYDNTSATLYPNWNLGTLTYSCTTPDARSEGSTNNITGAPRFVNPGGCDYRLTALSPCVDAGINESWMFGTRDIAGNPRILHRVIDLGAYEFAFQANLRGLLQGPYATNTHAMTTLLSTNIPLAAPYADDAHTVSAVPSNVVDWVFVEVRETNAAALVSKSAFLDRGGHVLTDGGGTGIVVEASAGNYYLVLKHRNHLAVMSAQPVAFTNQVVTYDFTTNSNRYYGGTNACVQLEPGVWGMIAGDADGDGKITAVDRLIVSNQTGRTGYLPGDLNLDGKADGGDR